MPVAKIGETMKLRPKNRQKRCYELSFKYLCWDERYNDGCWSLIQGEVTSDRIGTYGHAWLVSDTGRVYDPVRDKEYSNADYAAEFNAMPLTTYSLDEALRTACEQRHFGPWIEPPCGR
jgi:hypothetical protein